MTQFTSSSSAGSVETRGYSKKKEEVVGLSSGFPEILKYCWRNEYFARTMRMTQMQAFSSVGLLEVIQKDKTNGSSLVLVGFSRSSWNIIGVLHIINPRLRQERLIYLHPNQWVHYRIWWDKAKRSASPCRVFQRSSWNTAPFLYSYNFSARILMTCHSVLISFSKHNVWRPELVFSSFLSHPH